MSKEVDKSNIIKLAYSDLHKHIQNGEYEKSIKAINRILGVDANDEKAMNCKVICLMHISKFQEANQFIEKNKLNHLMFERAYCEYRLNRPEKALQIIDENDSLSLNLKELKAQVLYRLERYKESFELYKSIIRNTHDDYENERKTNMSAALANLTLESVNSDTEICVIPEDTYEIIFNAACALINQNKYSDAEKKLRESEKMCREFLEEEGATGEEIDEEISIIRLQLAYCLQKQGKIKDAAAIYAAILKTKSKDPALLAVASNNTVVINKDQNVFDSKKRIRAAMSEASEHKLMSYQKKMITLNNCLLSFYTSSREVCEQFCDKLIIKYPEMRFEATLIKCSFLMKDKCFKEAIENLQTFEKSNPKYRFATRFAIVQLHLLNGNRKTAIDILQELGEWKYKPGVISAIVTLHLGLDNKKAASDILKEAVDWYKTNNVDTGNLADMWRQAAEFHLRGGEAKTAASSLEELLKINSQDMKTMAQLVIAYAQYDAGKAKELSKKLPELGLTSSEIDIDALETANWIMSTRAVKKTTGKIDQSPGTSNSDNQKLKRKNKRKKKTKLPKNYNPNVLPDPERWLPKYERTGFRRKRDRRIKDVIKGSQGTATGASEKYDMTKTQNLGKNSPATQIQEQPITGPRHQHRKGGQKKKKGRH